MQMEPLLAEFYDDTQQEPEKEKRCRRYLAVAGMYFSFSEELARENDTDAMRKGIEVLEKAAGENMEGQWEAVIWQRLADACYLGGKSGDGEREQDWCQESFLYYERLLCSRQDGNRRKNLLRAAELALQFDMQEKAEQYLNEAAEIPGMEEDIFISRSEKDGRKQDEKKDHMRNDDRIPGRPGNRSPCGDTADDRRGRKCGGKRGIRS